MQAIIKPGKLIGTLKVPASKSMMQRACAGAILHKGKTTIYNPGFSDDDKAALQIIQQLGAKIIFQSEEKIEIISDGVVHAAYEIDCSESGLSTRMFTPIAAISSNKIKITGKGSLLQRPMNDFGSILTDLGVDLFDFRGFIPFTVQGPLLPKNLTMDGSVSSQFLTGVLFALSAIAQNSITINVQHLKSKPYVAMSLQMLEQFGKKIVNNNYEKFIIDPSKFEYKDDVEINIESDWSSAAYWLVGAAIHGNVSLENLNKESLQADRKILDALNDAGCNVVEKGNQLHVATSTLKAFHFDATDAPDLFPILSILAANCEGESSIKSLHRLIHKESNRANSIAEMLTAFGVRFKMENDSLFIEGTKKLKAAHINSYHDHRIAMAAAIGALNADGEVAIENGEAVSKSYPEFLKHLKYSGIDVRLSS